MKKNFPCVAISLCAHVELQGGDPSQFPHVLLITHIKPYIIEMNKSVPVPFKVENMVCMHDKR